MRDKEQLLCRRGATARHRPPSQTSHKHRPTLKDRLYSASRTGQQPGAGALSLGHRKGCGDVASQTKMLLIMQIKVNPHPHPRFKEHLIGFFSHLF